MGRKWIISAHSWRVHSSGGEGRATEACGAWSQCICSQQNPASLTFHHGLTEDQHLSRNRFGLLPQREAEASGPEDWVAPYAPPPLQHSGITGLCSLYHVRQANLSSLERVLTYWFSSFRTCSFAFLVLAHSSAVLSNCGLGSYLRTQTVYLILHPGLGSH